jgi:hypothetical protein
MNEAAPLSTEVQATRIGRVVSVSGSQLITLMDQHIGGDESPTARRPDIGEVVNVRTATTVAFGLVTGLSIPIPEQLEGRAELRIMELELTCGGSSCAPGTTACASAWSTRTRRFPPA